MPVERNLLPLSRTRKRSPHMNRRTLLRIASVMLATSAVGSLVAANGQTSATDLGAGSTGELAVLHKKTVESTDSAQTNTGKSRSHEDVEDQKHGITEIGLERTDNYGPSPAYTVVIKS